MVSIKTIDAKTLARMFLAGARNLEAKKEWINELNVFPVPDGDTGTNMTMTIMSAASEGYFFRLPSRRKRKLRRYSFPAFKRIYKKCKKSGASGCPCTCRSHGAGSGNCIQGCYEAQGRNHSYCGQRGCSESSGDRS